MLGHADLARQIQTPVCLDESIVSAQSAAAAIRLGACQIVNIKPGRVGGYLEARRIHDLCVAHGVPVWCGGMLETGLGRAANVALAALPGFTLPGDVSGSGRFYRTDITPPFVPDDGHLAVPTGPGLGVSPLVDELDAVTTGNRVAPGLRPTRSVWFRGSSLAVLEPRPPRPFAGRGGARPSDPHTSMATRFRAPQPPIGAFDSGVPAIAAPRPRSPG